MLLATLAAPAAWAQELKLHFIDVGQGDGAVPISPGGDVVLFDTGRKGACSKPLKYLRSLDIDHIDYLVVSHYHEDHIGCAAQVLSELVPSGDRGGDRRQCGGFY